MITQKLERGVEVAVVGRHHEVECRVSKAIAAVAAVTKILDAGRMNGKIALAQLELTTGRRFAPVRDRGIASAIGSPVALVEPELRYPAIKTLEREFIELPVRRELAVHVKQGGAAITRFGGLRFPAERGENGINLGCRVRRQERQILGIESVERRAYPTIGQPGLLVDGWRQHRLSAVGDGVAHPPPINVPGTRGGNVRAVVEPPLHPSPALPYPRRPPHPP